MDGPTGLIFFLSSLESKRNSYKKKNWKSCTENLKMLETFSIFKEIFV